MIPPWDMPTRSAATAAVIAAAVLSSDVGLTSTMVMVAPGATACTISASSTSSPKASQGETGPGNVDTTRSRAAGR